MSHSGRFFLMIAGALAFFAVPACAYASIRISEIMYDPPGANSGHQWIQIVSGDDSSINVAGYKLFQNGVNHGISVISGTTTILGGAVAIIANDPQQFLADYPGYSGALFKSAFSLRASGDSLALKDSKLNIADSVAYSSGSGASGDGNALYRISGTLTPGTPDPSTFHASAPAAIVKPAEVPPAPKTAKSASPKTSSKSASSRSSNTSSSYTAAPTDPNEASALAATAQNGLMPIFEIAAGSAAFGIVVVAGMLLSARFAPRTEPVPTREESALQKKKSPAAKDADEYEIIESEDTFL